MFFHLPFMSSLVYIQAPLLAIRQEPIHGKIATSLEHFLAGPIFFDCSLPPALYQLREAILSGRLSAGTRLPSTRELAGELDMARNTVLNAFEQLYAGSYLERRIGDGTYVSIELPDDLLKVQRAKNVRDTSRNGRSISKWGKSVASVSVSPGTILDHQDLFERASPHSMPSHTNSGARLLAHRWKIGREMAPLR